MGAFVKLIIVGVLVFGAFTIWKYGFAPEEANAPQSGALTDITDKDWVKGNPDAPVTLIEYTDFQCPACGAYYPILDQVSKDLGDKVKIVIRHFPLMQIHPNALPAARAAEAAGRQGKFWEMYDLLFVNQKEWSSAADPLKSIFPAYAGRIGLDVEQFKKDMSDSSLDDKITADRETGNDLKISGTPSFFLNGKKLENPGSLDALRKAIENAAK